MPTEAMVRATSASVALCSHMPVSVRPTAASSVAIAQCIRRSPERSEWMPLSTMAMVPATNGIAEISPICRLPLTPSSLMIDGDQNAMVALPLTTQK
ncbi:hypothetical protein D3C87_1067980 [compost metagenome]